MAGVGLALGCAVAQAQPRHGENVTVGRSSASQLKAEFDPETINELHALPAGDLFSGWADDGPGFQTLTEDEPAADFFALPEGARLRLEIVRADGAFAAVDGATFELLDEPGESKFLGPAPFESHVLWLINSADPAFDPAQTVWRIDLRLVDEDGAYAPSRAFTLAFTNVPEPSATAFLGLGSCWLFARRRKLCHVSSPAAHPRTLRYSPRPRAG